MYHLIRWFPKNNRLKIRILILLLSVGFLLPQFYVLLVEQSSRYCGQHLFGLLIASIVVTFVMLEDSVILVLAVSQQMAVSYWSWHLNRGHCHIGPSSVSTEGGVILVLAVSQQRAVSYWSYQCPNRGQCHIGPSSVSKEGSVILVLACISKSEFLKKS
ncbi:hypothetical protein BSL78_21502 [Apostichopus japonicus]|uniref:Uncharacterized protein n=1 Tax=Stichopus japonicus TaxID=307972 RepID=A0A2G8K0Y8_STIJA|nr:hypothetical protein BSL78_21502 [Apostichopus japonicus]